MADTSYVGDQRFCRMSRQMPPSAYTFGWNILLTNLEAENYLSFKCLVGYFCLSVRVIHMTLTIYYF